MDAREDGLLMSGIQHFAFCRRQWALIHIEKQWQENARTAQGQLDHVRCHDETLSEKRDDTFTVRGLEGEAAKLYFGVFNHLVLQQQSDFRFTSRSRRPPLDNINALLSFAYTLLTRDCTAALESAGLDPYIGFMHRPRPGRRSLALDLMEELRAVYADRFVLSCVNRKIITAKHLQKQESGAVLLTDDGRRAFLGAWQSKKQEQITHPFLKEKIPWGLVPYVQALLLARTLRGDLEAYPPFFWK